MSAERDPDARVQPCDAPAYRRFREDLRVQAKRALAGRRRRQALRRAALPAALGVAATLVFALSWTPANAPEPGQSVARLEAALKILPNRNVEAVREDSAASGPEWVVHTRALPPHLRAGMAAPVEVASIQAARQENWVVRTKPLPESFAIASHAVQGLTVRSPRSRRIEEIAFADLPRPAGGGTYALVGYDSSTQRLLLLDPPPAVRRGLPKERIRMP